VLRRLLSPSPRARKWRFWALLVFVALATCVFLAIGNGNPVVGLVPAAGVAAVYAILKARLRTTVLVFLAAAFAFENTMDRPYSELWSSPFLPFGMMIYHPLNSLTGIGALKFAIIDLFLFLMIGVILHRRLTRKDLDPPTARMPPVLALAIGLSWVTVASLIFWGILGGGDTKMALWVSHQLFVLPGFAFVFHHAFRGTEDLVALGKTLVLGAAVKSVWGSYYKFVIVPGLGREVEYTTGHADTLLYVAGLAILLLMLLYEPNRKNFKRALLLVPVILSGMIANDRRLADVSLVGCLLTGLLMMPRTRLKRSLLRFLVLASPLITAYVTVGWTRTEVIFSPVATLRSIFDQEDTELSSGGDSRDVENANLITSFVNGGKRVFGTGFGHEYDEQYVMPYIAAAMPHYRYQPHNAVLWLLMVGGIVGFTALWLYLAVSVYLAARAFHRAPPGVPQVGALMCICLILCYLNQCFGDMGASDWLGVLMVSLASVMAGHLAVQLKGYPVGSSLRPAEPRVEPAGPILVPPVLP
jgi:hypothetical protein